jgi:phage tail-like protein
MATQRQAPPGPDGKPGCRFYVQVDGWTQAVFTEVTGLAMEMAVEDIEEGGLNDFVHRLPGRCKTTNLTLKRGLTNSNDFLVWSQKVAKGEDIKNQKKNVSVILFNLDGTESMRWEFTKAYPVKWSGPSFKADDNAVAVETLELAHEGMKIP